MAIQAQLYPDNIIGGFPLGGIQDWMMDSGCGGGYNELCFNLQQKHQQQNAHSRQQHQQRNQNLFLDNSFSFSSSKVNTNINNANLPHHQSMPTNMAFPSRNIAAVQAEEQRQELDRFIAIQNERLRLALQEQRRQLLTTLLSKFESKTLSLLRQKDEEIAQAAKRTAELENFLRKLEIESQAWQRAAIENEAMVRSLNNKIEEIRERASGDAFLSTNGAELDAGSCCDVNLADAEEGTGENRGNVEPTQDERARNMVCQSCNSQTSCVMFLPCRHLCSCNACESFLHSCPICRTPKKASIEVLIF